jgi:biotin transporter BioY
MVKDLRKYTQSTVFRLILGGAIIIFVLGAILIAIFYGINSALFGLLCLLAALIPVGIIALIFILINRYVESERKKQE